MGKELSWIESNLLGDNKSYILEAMDLVLGEMCSEIHKPLKKQNWPI
jgi:hypothetical protein